MTGVRSDKRPHCLYRAYDEAGALLYVGTSCNVRARLGVHDKESEWARFVDHMSFEQFPNKASARRAENLAIKSEGPEYNRWGAVIPPECVKVGAFVTVRKSDRIKAQEAMYEAARPFLVGRQKGLDSLT